MHHLVRCGKGQKSADRYRLQTEMVCLPAANHAIDRTRDFVRRSKDIVHTSPDQQTQVIYRDALRFPVAATLEFGAVDATNRDHLSVPDEVTGVAVPRRLTLIDLRPRERRE